MKLKKISGTLALAIGTACLVFTTFTCPVATISAKAAVPEVAQPYQHVLEYIYIVRDHKIYKRLYNSTIGVWIDPDWTYVRDWPYDYPYPGCNKIAGVTVE